MIMTRGMKWKIGYTLPTKFWGFIPMSLQVVQYYCRWQWNSLLPLGSFSGKIIQILMGRGGAHFDELVAIDCVGCYGVQRASAWCNNLACLEVGETWYFDCQGAPAPKSTQPLSWEKLQSIFRWQTKIQFDLSWGCYQTKMILLSKCGNQ